MGLPTAGRCEALRSNACSRASDSCQWRLRLSGAGIKEIKKLAAAKARHLGNEEGEEVRKAFGRLSILLMRGNSAILANRIPAQE